VGGAIGEGDGVGVGGIGVGVGDSDGVGGTGSAACIVALTSYVLLKPPIGGKSIVTSKIITVPLA